MKPSSIKSARLLLLLLTTLSSYSNVYAQAVTSKMGVKKEITPKVVQLTAQEQALASWIEAREQDMLEELATHVNINTGSGNIQGLNTYRELLKQDLLELGFSVEQHSSEPIPVLSCTGGQQEVADHLVAKIGGGSTNRLFLNGHMDTVFSKDDEFQKFSVDANGVLKGPGIADMKGGIVVMLNALRALQKQGLLANANMTVLFNSDEEIGSISSRSLIEKIARQHDIGFVFEGSGQNLVTRARKGLGQVRLKITGRESHAGAQHEDGVSASLELAHKVIEIEKLTRYEQHTTVNVGVMRGGEKRNTIPGCADAHIDMRYPDTQAGESLKSKILDIVSKPSTMNSRYPELPKIESWSILHRPAKAVNQRVDELIGEAMGLSVQLGEPIVGTYFAGGGTDGSLTQAVGLPTIDSMGVNGAGAHSSREESTVKSLMARTKLAAVMLARQISKKP